MGQRMNGGCCRPADAIRRMARPFHKVAVGQPGRGGNLQQPRSLLQTLLSLVTTPTRMLWSNDPHTKSPSLSGDQSNDAMGCVEKLRVDSSSTVERAVARANHADLAVLRQRRNVPHRGTGGDLVAEAREPLQAQQRRASAGRAGLVDGRDGNIAGQATTAAEDQPVKQRRCKRNQSQPKATMEANAEPVVTMEAETKQPRSGEAGASSRCKRGSCGRAPPTHPRGEVAPHTYIAT
eukprot:350426-Chlamydomonas_euryale.AAC.4